jgi:hypothetical protein
MNMKLKTLNEIDQLVNQLYRQDPKLKDTKFGYAYKRFVEKNYQSHLKDYQLDISTARVEHALEDEKTKEVLTDRLNERGFKYSKEGLKAIMKAEAELTEKWNNKEVEVEPFISSHVPELTEDQRELLSGILIDGKKEKKG